MGKIYDPLASSVCDVCQGFGDLNSPRGFVLERKASDMGYPPQRYIYTYVHHADITALLASAELGCELCAVMRDGLRHVDAYRFHRSLHARPQTRGDAQPISIADTAQSDTEALAASRFAEIAKQKGQYEQGFLREYGHGRVVIQSICDSECGPSELKGDSEDTVKVLDDDILVAYLCHLNIKHDPLDPEHEHRPSNDLLSEPHIGLINRWRHTCKENHFSCRETASDQPFPSRILELMDPSDANGGVRLVETHGKMRGAYACLSYCWGDAANQIGETTRNNLHQQLKAIPIHTLPKTVVDAIYLCYKLGLRFLWVDRLCIVQDDQEDWAMEASTMCDVYSRCALTISVPICAESSQSFLEERRKGFREQSRFAAITYTDGQSEPGGSLWFWKDRGHPFGKEGPLFLEHSWYEFCRSTGERGNRWSSRGWTFQEWMLSPRVLHIHSITLWDCFNGYANELNRRDMERARLIRSPRDYGQRMSWQSIVQEYSRRVITREEDRLPALAGLAARYAQATGRTYLAGLWREEMPRSLLWTCFLGHKCSRRNANAPTWSWASLSGAAINDYITSTRNFIARVSIESAYCRYNPPNSFSVVEEAYIDVKGYISLVTEQDQDKSIIKAGDKWWKSFSDCEGGFPDNAIAQSTVFLLLLGSTEGYYRTLVLEECGRNGDHECFQRLGDASGAMKGEETRPLELGTSWEARTVRLV